MNAPSAGIEAVSTLPRVCVLGLEDSKYTSQWLGGLLELDASGAIDLQFGPRVGLPVARQRAHYSSWLTIDQSPLRSEPRRVFMDLGDSAEFADREALERCDIYFKRGYVSSVVARLPEPLQHRIRRLPLQFPVVTPLQDRRQRVGRALAAADRRQPLATLQAAASALLRGSRISERFGARPLAPTLDQLRGSERAPIAARVYLRTRLYEPKQARDEAGQQALSELNAQRIGLIKVLREAFGPLAHVGLYETATNERMAPELIRPLPSDYQRPMGHYEFAKHCLVNVNTVGVSGSNGWKIGEILASGTCLVTEELQQEPLDVPCAGVHAETFRTPEQCVSACQKLLADPEYASAMRVAGAAFFEQFLAPAAAVRRMLQAAQMWPA